jgi:hypothetical protein
MSGFGETAKKLNARPDCGVAARKAVRIGVWLVP